MGSKRDDDKFQCSQQTDSQQSSSRPITRLATGDQAGALRQLLILFAGGVRRDDRRLAQLHRFLVQFIFAPTVERGVEGRHSIIKKITRHAPHFSGAFVSLSMRMPAVRRYLQTKPDFFGEVVRFMEQCLDPFYLMKHLGLLRHPSVPSELQPGCFEHLPLLTKIVYRHDVNSQFKDWSALRRFLWQL